MVVIHYRMNLYELIKKNNFQGFSIPLIRRFAYSILQCLRVLHKDKIIHCDLKPVRYKSYVGRCLYHWHLEGKLLCRTSMIMQATIAMVKFQSRINIVFIITGS